MSIGGAGKPALRDVAALAGVHIATASRALSGSQTRPVNERTASKVRAAAVSLGYVADEAARSLRTSRARAIGILIPDMSNPVMPPLVQGAEHVLAEHGYTTLFADTDNDVNNEAQRLSMFLSWRVSGMILATARRVETLPAVLAQSGIPVVLMTRTFDTTAVSSVTVDESVGVGEALDHLISLGHRRIAYIGVPLWTSVGYDRVAAFRSLSAARRLSSPEQYVVVCDGYSESHGEVAMAELLRLPEPPTAVLCGNDMMALGCYSAVAECGLSCPEDVSIIGYNDMPLTDRLSPPLTTVKVPHFDVGKATATLLVEELKGDGGQKRSIRLLPKLVIRDSTTQPRET